MSDQETLVSLNAATFHLVATATGMVNHEGELQTLRLTSQDKQVQVQIPPKFLPFVKADDHVVITFGFVKATASIVGDRPQLLMPDKRLVVPQ